VNLASRVQGATKYLKTKLLITGPTHAQLDPSFHTRRLCEVRVVNIAEPVELHELVPEGQPGWPRAKQDYEKALEQFQQKSFRIAARILGNLRGDFPDDGPALVLLSRAVNGMVEEPSPFDPVWELPGK
jgi:adenylate cyclase